MTDTNAGLAPRAREVLDFWFGGVDMDAARAEWFRKDAAFDAQIAQRFGDVIVQAIAGGLRDWESDPAAALARIIVLDQFTRNTGRDTPRAFAGDALALAAARRMVAHGWDRLRPPGQRSFIYLPFEHCEDLGMQDESIRLFAALADEHPAHADALGWAHKHRDIIRRFGRFPHRNAALGRASTTDEETFLTQPGSRF